jgi:hypothetical protein
MNYFIILLTLILFIQTNFLLNQCIIYLILNYYFNIKLSFVAYLNIHKIYLLKNNKINS